MFKKRVIENSIGDFSMVFKPHHRAKRMKLRYDAATNSAVITMPPRSKKNDAEKFVKQNLTWLEKQRMAAPVRQYLFPGFIIPFKGQDHLIIHKPDSTGRVLIQNNEIIIGGPLEGLPVRLENYLRKQARIEIEPIAKMMAFKINKKIKRIQIRDTKSRWGSCSSSGALSFSWRLIMTPPEILEYVVAHEVAHLEELNHSYKFWTVVDQLVDHAKNSRKWLKTKGQKLMLIQKDIPADKSIERV